MWVEKGFLNIITLHNRANISTSYATQKSLGLHWHWYEMVMTLFGTTTIHVNDTRKIIKVNTPGVLCQWFKHVQCNLIASMTKQI